MKRAVQEAVAKSVALRRRLPWRLQDSLFNLPSTIVERADALCREREWPVTRASRPMAPTASATGCAKGEVAREEWFTVCEVPNGRVLGSACTAIAPNGVILADVSPDSLRCLSRHRVLRSFLWAPSPRRIAGTAGLLGASGRHNYYHWMFDMLPRLGMIEHHEDIRRVDHWITPVTKLAVVPELLARCGVPLERVRSMGRFGHVQCERLLVTEEPSPLSGSMRLAIEFLRSRLGHATRNTRGRRRLLVLRRSSRRVSNLAELDSLIARFRLEPVYLEAASLDDQIALFSEAELAVGIHGAGLANLAFMPEGSSVVEILPDWYPAEFFRCLARDAGLHFERLAGERLPGGSRPDAHSDFRVEPSALEKAIVAALSPRSR